MNELYLLRGMVVFGSLLKRMRMHNGHPVDNMRVGEQRNAGHIRYEEYR